MTEDWKGENFIRGIKPTREERHAETSRLSAAVKAKTAPKQKTVAPGFGSMSRVMRAAMSEQGALNRRSSEGVNYD